MVFTIRRALGAAAFAALVSTRALTAQAPPAPAPAPAPPPVTVGGVVYAQYLYQLQDTANHQNNFDVTRGYLNVIGKFSGGVYTRVTLDLFTVTGSAGNNDNGSYDYRLKYAYVAWTPAKSPLTYKMGMIHTPWLDYEEGMWDYRMQGTMAMDRNGYLTSSDIGVGIDGNFNKDQANFQLTGVNGEGYHGGVGDQRKDVEARVGVRLLATDDGSSRGGLRLNVYGQVGKPNGGGKRQRVLAMLSYRSKMATLAAQAASTVDSSGAAATLNGHVYSAFGVFHVPQSKAALIARVDLVKKQTGVATAGAANELTRFIFGASYQVSPNLRILADWDNLGYKVNPTLLDATRSQALFQIQFTF